MEERSAELRLCFGTFLHPHLCSSPVGPQPFILLYSIGLFCDHHSLTNTCFSTTLCRYSIFFSIFGLSMLHWHVAKVQWIPLEIRWIAVLFTCGKAHRTFSSNSHATERWDDRKVHRVQKGVWMSYISLKHYSLINNINDTYWADYFSTDCWIDSESGCLTFGLKNKKLQTWLAKIASVMSTSCVGN